MNPMLHVRVVHTPTDKLPKFELDAAYLLLVSGPAHKWNQPATKVLPSGRVRVDVPLQNVQNEAAMVRKWVHSMLKELPWLDGAVMVVVQPRTAKGVGVGLVYWPCATKPGWDKIGVFDRDMVAEAVAEHLYGQEQTAQAVCDVS